MLLRRHAGGHAGTRECKASVQGLEDVVTLYCASDSFGFHNFAAYGAVEVLIGY